MRVVTICNSIVLVFHAGSGTSATVTFEMGETSRTHVILRLDFCNAHIEAICPRPGIVELTDYNSDPINNG